jgi:NADH:ubiquinone oxidoreductase subunit 2 (subunit N)
VQLLFLDLLGPSFFIAYYSAYFISLLGLVSIFYSRLSPLVAMLSLGGLPPLALFWGKLLALRVLPTPYSALLLLSSSIALFSYVTWALASPTSRFSSVSVLARLSFSSYFLTSFSF